MKNLTPIQLKTRQSYNTYKNFLVDYKPEQLLVLYDDINSIAQSVVCVRLTVEDVNAVYSYDKFPAGVDYVEKWLDFLNRFSNINKPLVETKAVAYMLYNDYKHFHLADLKVLFKLLMMGEYGSFYGSVDAQRILTAFASYARERDKQLLLLQQSLERFVDMQFEALYSDADARAYREAKEKGYDYMKIAKIRSEYRAAVDSDKQGKMESYKQLFYEKLKEKIKTS